MVPMGTFRKRTCTKCFKYLKLYIRCFKCDAIYHAKCLLKEPGFQVDQRGRASCCRNITFESNQAKEILVSQEKLVVLRRDEGSHSNKDLENCLPKEKDLERNEFKCNTCSLECTNEEQPENHYGECPDKQRGLLQELYKEKVGLVCSLGNEANFQEESYDQHIRRCEEYCAQLKVQHSNTDKKCKCGEWKCSAHHKCDLVKHTGIHTNERPFKCDSCSYAATRRWLLKDHILARHSNAEKRYKCSDCKYSTHYKTNLVKHIRIHTNERFFKCDICNYSDIRRCNLNRHISEQHPNAEKMYKCSNCEYITHHKSDLVKHIRIHSNERPFKCNACNYAAIRKGALNRHILAKHSNAEKMYKCSDCEYSVHQKSKLVKHMRAHTNERLSNKGAI